MNVKDAPRKLAQALLLPINPAAVVLLGIYTTVWGAWLASPFWTVFTQAPLFSVLARAAPDFVPAEYFWGTIAIICGSITIYGAVKRSYRALITGASVAGWHWLMIATFYFWGDWQNTGGITALIFCVYACFIYVNIRVNYKDRHKSYGILGP
jgi:hypothetical protein